jgi:hypothetical protein
LHELLGNSPVLWAECLCCTRLTGFRLFDLFVFADLVNLKGDRLFGGVEAPDGAEIVTNLVLDVLGDT